MILPAVTLLAAIAIPQVPPVDIGTESDKLFAFDWDGKYEDGTDGAVVVQAEFRFVDSTGAVSLVKIPHAGVVGENVVRVQDGLGGIGEGVYDMAVRVIDPGGQGSEFSDVLVIRVVEKKPSRPVNVRVVER